MKKLNLESIGSNLGLGLGFRTLDLNLGLTFSNLVFRGAAVAGRMNARRAGLR